MYICQIVGMKYNYKYIPYLLFDMKSHSFHLEYIQVGKYEYTLTYLFEEK